jgi:aminocarboxymuconate-semialdehyde decarboxylase
LTPTVSSQSAVIDVHSHFFPEEFLGLLEREGPAYGAGLDRRAEVAILSMPGHPPVPLSAQFVDPDARLARLDVQAIAVQALSLSPPMVYWAPAGLGVALARAFNDGIAALCRRHPTRFVGLATLPMQDVGAAVGEMTRAVRELDMRGIYLATSVRGCYLDDPQFRPVWEHAHRLRVPVFTHPHTHLGAVELGSFHLFNTIGFPTETAVLMGRLIYSGLFAAYPDVRVVVAHAGGTAPVLLGRLDHAYRNRRELQQALPEPPSAYVRHFVFDTIAHEDRTLRFVIETVGVERVVVGTDAPYDMADDEPAARIARLELPDRDQAAILTRTAARLLKVPLAQTVSHG